MRALLGLPLLALAACAGTAPVAPVTPPPAAPVVVRAPEPEPIRVVEAPEVREVAPVSPPEARRGRIARRALFEQAGVATWRLANGLEVVYLRAPGAEGYRARVEAPTGWASLPRPLADEVAAIGTAAWGPLRAEVGPYGRVAGGEAETLAALLEAVERLFTASPDRVEGSTGLWPRTGVLAPEGLDAPRTEALAAEAFDRPASFVVLLAGDVEWEWVEGAVANALGGLRGRDSSFGPILDAPPRLEGDSTAAVAAPVLEAEVAGGWGDLPTVRVLDAVLDARSGGEARVSLDADAGRVRLWARGASTALAPPSDDEVRAARVRAARDAASAAGRLEALATLYGVPGDFRPARNPAEATGLEAPIERTPPDRVRDLLRRLLASPDAARIRP